MMKSLSRTGLTIGPALADWLAVGWPNRRFPAGRAAARSCPPPSLFTFCIQAITGFFLWVYYSPSAQTAWESVYFLQNEVVGGWLLRAIHHYSAHVLLALLILYRRAKHSHPAYRAPRELVFWATVGLGLCAPGGHPHRRLALVGPERLRLDEDADRLPHVSAVGGRQSAEAGHRRPGPGVGTPHAHAIFRPARRAVWRRLHRLAGDSRRVGPPGQRRGGRRRATPCPTGPRQACAERGGVPGRVGGDSGCWPANMA